MPLNLPRLQRVLRRALARRPVDLWQRSEREWTICPASTVTVKPALFPQGAMERVTALTPWRSWGVEQTMVHGGVLSFGPTRAGLLRNVDFVDGHLFAGAATEQVGVDPARWVIAPAAREPDIEAAQLVSTHSGAVFFGCLLLDDFLLEMLADDPPLRLSVPGKPSGHEADYRALLGLAEKRVLRRGRVRLLTHYEEPAFNDSKVARYRTLRERLRARVDATQPPPAGIYLRRGNSGQRRVMANEPAIEAALERRGFTVIDPMALPAAEIVRQALGARVVVSVEGSQISHAIFAMADEAAMVVLQPPDRFGMQYKEFTDAMDMRFAFVVGRPAEQGFEVDLTELQHLLDRL